MEKAIKVTDLVKCKGNNEILHHVNFEIAKGEITGFLGANGAGKTTTMKCILNLCSYKGKIEINGKNALKEHQKVSCMVSGLIEEPCFYLNMTGIENIKLNMMYYGKISQNKLDKVISELHLDDFIHRKVKSYSLGMKQRLGIALALINEPEILLLDEPMNGLDPSGIRDLRELLIKLAHGQGKAVFVSSHILSEMQMLCDRVIFIKEGSVVGNEVVGDNLEEQYMVMMGEKEC